MQVSDLTAILNSVHKSTLKSYNVTNSESVVSALQSKAGLDGIDSNTLSATAISTHNNIINVNLTATGYKDNQTTANTSNSAFVTGQIVINPTATYNLTATATATMDTNGVYINVNSIQITSLQKIIGQ
jgi:hypothetical protein